MTSDVNVKFIEEEDIQSNAGINQAINDMFAWPCVYQHQSARRVICFTDKTHSTINPIPHHDDFLNKIWPVEMTAEKKVGSHTVDKCKIIKMK